MPCSGAPPPPQKTARQLSFDELLLPGGSARTHRFRRGYVAWLCLMGYSDAAIRGRTGHGREEIASDRREVAAYLESLMGAFGFDVREEMRSFRPER